MKRSLHQVAAASRALALVFVLQLLQTSAKTFLIFNLVLLLSRLDSLMSL